MKAMIFAAGLGTRLRPITDSIPKALVPVGGVPMLQRVITNLKNAGFDHIIVNVHHFPDMIINFLKANQNFGIDIAISDERERLLDTGGGIAKASCLLNGTEPVLVHNADILTDINLVDFYNRHISSNADASLIVSNRKTSRYLLFDKEMKMHGWINEKTGESKPQHIDKAQSDLQKYAFNGIHVISPSLLPELTAFGKNEPFSIIDFYISNCQHKAIHGYLPQSKYSWFDIGKPDSLSAADRHISEEA